MKSTYKTVHMSASTREHIKMRQQQVFLKRKVIEEFYKVHCVNRPLEEVVNEIRNEVNS